MKKLAVALVLVLMVVCVHSWQRQPAPPASPSGATPRASSPSGIVPPEGMVLVVGGVFPMGSDDHPLEAPVRNTQVDSFFMDRFPVTNTQFRAFVKASGYRPTGLWTDYDRPGRERHPVVHVTWNDAAAYAQWAGKRLPTEAEWEKSARGTDGRVFPWGNEVDLARCNLSGTDTTPVDAHPSGRSPLGVEDMAGNVFEWTADRLSAEMVGRVGAPLKEQTPCVLKGGCYLYSTNWCRSSYFYFMVDYRSSYLLGFRCARSVDPTRAEEESKKPFHAPSPRKKGSRALESGEGYDEAARQIINNGALEPVKDSIARYYMEFMGLPHALAARGSLEVADIGSGPGFPSVYMAGNLGPRATLHAVDVDRSVVAYLQDLRKHPGFENIQPVLSQKTDVSLPTESMDFVFCLGTYSYMVSNHDETMGARYQKEARPFLQSIHRALRPGGRFAIFNASRMLEWPRARTQIERCGFKVVKVEFKRDALEKYSALFEKIPAPE